MSVTYAWKFTILLLLLQGKFIRINFDVAGYIVGANIETCILLYVFNFKVVKSVQHIVIFVIIFSLQ